MEQIIYRLTLDVHKGGVQKTLQGFQTNDNMARRIVISLVSGGKPYVIPTDSVVAAMFVNNGKDVNACQFDDDTIVYDVLPSDITEEGIVNMQFKLIGTTVNGIERAIIAPRFALEVTESETNESGAVANPQFTALENALAMANAVYTQRLLRVEFDDEYVFRAYYADGTIYENDTLTEIVRQARENGELAHSYMVSAEGFAKDAKASAEDAEKSATMSNSAKAEALNASELAQQLAKDAMKHSSYTEFEVDFETGELLYTSQAFVFDINEETGNLEYDNVERR